MLITGSFIAAKKKKQGDGSIASAPHALPLYYRLQTTYCLLPLIFELKTRDLKNVTRHP
jgi:hypothetical protein